MLALVNVAQGCGVEVLGQHPLAGQELIPLQ